MTINGAHIVDLSKNSIHAVDRNSFAWGGTIQLQFLYLSVNNIVYVESGAFDDLLNLEHVDLSNNELESVPADIVAENGRIKMLSLAQNMLIHQVPTISSDSLQVLDLSWNKLDTILPETFAFLPNLERLELQSNNFRYISTDTFLALPNLMYIDLNINVWTCNCDSQKLFEFVTSRGLFNATAPIICRKDDDKSTGEIYLENGVAVSRNYCYDRNTYRNVILFGDDPRVVKMKINITADDMETIMVVNDPSDNDPSILTADDVIALSPEVEDVVNQSKDDSSSRNTTKITIYQFRYSMLNIFNLMVFIVLMVFVAKMLVMCMDVCKSLSEGHNTEESLLYKGTQMQIV